MPLLRDSENIIRLPSSTNMSLLWSYRSLLQFVMTLPQCTIELKNDAVSDTTDADSSNTAHYIIITLVLKNSLQMKQQPMTSDL
ncbi:MAG TPA: hypothetical protein VL095_07195 [Flavisolibacter sp.]|nr:hypothetical protein [Flavisolibacter sp.]